MKISKEVNGYMVNVYDPSKKEREQMNKVSDEIIDLIQENNLDDDQIIHLISSLYTTMKRMYGIEKMAHCGEVDDLQEKPS